MMCPADCISPAYCAAQKVMHADPRGYGSKGDRWAATVLEIARRYDAYSVLDYGCGEGSLARALKTAGMACREYDPAIPGKDAPPMFADLVVSTDVLEHVEPERLANTLTHIRQLARKVVFLVIATRPAGKRLPTGGNAHLIIEPPGWWERRVVAAGFTLQPPPTVWPKKVPGPGKAWIGVVTP